MEFAKRELRHTRAVGDPRWWCPLATRLVPQKRHRSGPMATRRSGERTKRIAPAKLSPAQGGLLQICETQMTSEKPLDKKRPIQGGAKRRMRAATRSGAVVPLAG